MQTFLSFLAFTLFVASYSWYRLRKEKLDSNDSYFLGGRSLTGLVIATSMLLTNISTEHLIGMNGSAYKNGFIIIAWEVTSALALVVAALYFIPTYLRMGLTTIPQYLEERYDSATRTIVALFLLVAIGALGSMYAIFGGLKAVAYSDTINGIGLLLGGLLVPILALWDIGDGSIMSGLSKVYNHAREKIQCHWCSGFGAAL